MSRGRRLVIGDIHGCLQTFRFMVEDVMQLNRVDHLWLLGDFIDRGPASKGVIDYILKLKMSSYKVTPLMGNHEFMMIRSVADRDYFDLWMENSGFTTLRDFGISIPDQRSISRITPLYFDFLQKLPLIQEIKGFVLVHAGLDPAAKDPLANPEYLLWNREASINKKFLGDRKLVHGHTPKTLDEIRTMLDNPDSRSVPLDGGCVYSSNPRFGYLVGLDLDDLHLFYLKNRE